MKKYVLIEKSNKLIILDSTIQAYTDSAVGGYLYEVSRGFWYMVYLQGKNGRISLVDCETEEVPKHIMLKVALII